MKTHKIRNILLVSTLLSIVSCSSQESNSNKEIDPSIFWAISGNEKVIKKRDRKDYEYLKKDLIQLSMCQGEYESGQLVISPTADINSYYASIDGLISKEGNSISKQNIEVLGAKYLNVREIFDSDTGSKPGQYPDALVPLDALKAYHDNKIPANENQSIYVKVKTDINQAPGLYKGDLNIDIDGAKISYPIEVTVNDVKVNPETHTKSIFLNNWHYQNGELDCTDDELLAYNRACYDYRLSGHLLTSLNTNNFTDEEIEKYAELAYQDMQNPGCSNVSLPYTTIPVSVPKVEISFDENVMKKYITAFFIKSISSNYNMFKKTSVYMGFIDEPDDVGIPERAKYVCNRYRIVINEIVDVLDNYYRDNPLHDEIIQSLRDMPNVVTCSWNETFDGYIDTYCPKANFYNTKEQRSCYDFQKEKWWYTCVYPRAPFPTYHIEDTLCSARLLSWMQSNYDVTGNLFWATNVYAKMQNGVYYGIDEYYSGDADRYYGVNGDGYLFYPGRQYGLDHPAGSVRLEAIRDGLEEFELLYNLKESYKNLELDNSSLFDFLIPYCYEGTIVNARTLEMERAREDLIALSLANKNGSDFLVTKSQRNEENSTVDLEFYAKNGSEIKVNGFALTPISSYKEGNIYKVNVEAKGNTNIARIDVNYGNNKTVISHNLGGKSEKYSGNALSTHFKKYNASVTASVTNLEDYGEVVKLDIGKTTNRRQSIQFVGDFVDSLNSNVKSLTFNIINPSDDSVSLSIGNRFAAITYDSYFVENVELKPGLNKITVNLSNTRWNDLVKLNYLTFVFGDNTSSSEDARTIYMKEAIMSFKQGGGY